MMSELDKRVVRPRYVVFCDDIRREDSGKMLLIGVYGNAVIYRSLPAEAGLSAWIVLDQLQEGDFDFHCKYVMGLNESTVAEVHGRASIRAENNVGFSLPFIPIRFDTEGTLSLLFKVGGGPWDTLGSIEVRKGPIPPTAS
jgi:hypothetical protein